MNPMKVLLSRHLKININKRIITNYQRNRNTVLLQFCQNIYECTSANNKHKVFIAHTHTPLSSQH